MTGQTPRLAALTREQKQALALELLAERQRREVMTASARDDQQRDAAPAAAPAGTGLDFSLFYFSSDEAAYRDDKYRLVLEGARFADEHGFKAIWIPERHFHPVGGLFPNPAVLGAALAMRTRNLRIRAGSVVLPLHQPLRVVEEWAVVDNLSGGRVDLALVPGWNANDFVLAPDRYTRRKEWLFATVATIRQLWQGGSITLANGEGDEVAVRAFPRPAQPELPLWITTSASDESFVRAGELGTNVISALLIQSVDELARRISLYRAARARSGHDPSTGHVTVMLNTFLAGDLETARRKIRGPFRAYMQSVADLWQKRIENLTRLPQREREAAMDVIFERYFHQSALFGTPDSCLRMVRKLQAVGANEIACMIDFGVDFDSTIDGLHHLNVLRERIAAEAPPGPLPEHH